MKTTNLGEADGLPAIEWSQVETQLADLLTHDDPRSPDRSTFWLTTLNADGSPHRLPDLTLSRGARHLRFLPGSGTLVVLKGEIRHKDLWSVDVETGAEHQLTNVAPGFEIRDFDLSVDGRALVLERGEAHSSVVLLDLSER